MEEVSQRELVLLAAVPLCVAIGFAGYMWATGSLGPYSLPLGEKSWPDKVANITHWKGGQAHPVTPEDQIYTELRQVTVTAISKWGGRLKEANTGPCMERFQQGNVLQVTFTEPINPAEPPYEASFRHYIFRLDGDPKIHPVKPDAGCGAFHSDLDWQRKVTELLERHGTFNTSE